MNSVTQKVTNMYERFPYPSPEADRSKLKELEYLMKIFSIENNIDFSNKNILDAGTGTGHRLSQAAKAYPEAKFKAVDYCSRSIELARTIAKQEGLSNVEFDSANLMEDLTHLGSFDLVLCIGVLHHLSSPKNGLQNLVRILSKSGIIILWLYGSPGGQERMRKKNIIRTLLQGDAQDFDTGIQLVKDLQFDEFEFGWNLSDRTEAERNSLIVGAFLNVNEELYTAPKIHDLMEDTGLSAYAISGITSAETPYLVDTALAQNIPLHCKAKDLVSFLKTDLLREKYNTLSTLEKYKLVDLFCAPSGYTVIGFTDDAVSQLPVNGRILSNLIQLA